MSRFQMIFKFQLKETTKKSKKPQNKQKEIRKMRAEIN